MVKYFAVLSTALVLCVSVEAAPPRSPRQYSYKLKQKYMLARMPLGTNVHKELKMAFGKNISLLSSLVCFLMCSVC